MAGLDDANAPGEIVALIGGYARDTVTGISGRIIAACFYQGDATQLQLRRYGVDGNGHPYPLHWVHLSMCSPISADDAKAR